MGDSRRLISPESFCNANAEGLDESTKNLESGRLGMLSISGIEWLEGIDGRLATLPVNSE